jgi:hypothetical protein
VSNPDDPAPGSSSRPRDVHTGPPPASGRPVKKSAVPKNSAPPKKTSGAKKPQEPALAAAEYSRTTGGSPGSTAVIPAIKDEPQDATKQSSAKTSSAKPSSAKSRPATAPASAAQSGRRASLRLVHIEPWSVTRLAFVVSVAMMIVAVVAVSIFWIVLNVTGVWGQINDSVTSVLSDDSGSFDIKDYLGFGRLVGLTLVLSAINVILMTALATIGAHLYNLAAQLLGGLEVTFSDD